jgi:hypothetical protein
VTTSCTTVSNPKVLSTNITSLSMDLGT